LASVVNAAVNYNSLFPLCLIALCQPFCTYSLCWCCFAYRRVETCC